jgi:DNA-binding NarL/FixJ family response regulator
VVRVLIADDEPLIRNGIRLVLASAEDIEVVAEASDGRQAVDEASRRSVDVALLDIRMPGMDGLSALKELQRVVPRTRVVVLTTFGEDEYISRALAGGAAGFLLKDSAPDELIRAVRAVAAGEAYLSPAVTQRVIGRFRHDDMGRVSEAKRRLEALSERELEVLKLLARGLSNADIGGRLFVSEATVKTYMSRLLTKLDCANRVQAALLAQDAGIVDDGS